MRENSGEATSGAPVPLDRLRKLLADHVAAEADEFFGFRDADAVARVVSNWFDDANNYDGRWKFLAERNATGGRILDMAAGCGTFVLFGLRNGLDVTGIEPEAWKLRYFCQKLEASQLPSDWKSRVVWGLGESLPFPDESFDVVTTYQTLEHVADVRQSIHELLRVLKPGGHLYLRAPDYDSFYEPHYALPFLPRMSKPLARRYLRLLGKPVSGLETLNWTTERSVIEALRSAPWDVTFVRSRQFEVQKLVDRLTAAIQGRAARGAAFFVVDLAARTWAAGKALLWVGRREKNIDLWITRLGAK